MAKREWNWIDGKIYNVQGGFFVAMVNTDNDRTGSVMSPPFQTAIAAMDWLLEQAKERASGLSFEVSWKEAVTE